MKQVCPLESFLFSVVLVLHNKMKEKIRVRIINKNKVKSSKGWKTKSKTVIMYR